MSQQILPQSRDLEGDTSLYYISLSLGFGSTEIQMTIQKSSRWAINYPLCGKALLRHEPGADGGDDGGAVAAGVGGRQGQEGGGEDECLQVDYGGQHDIIYLWDLIFEQSLFHQEGDWIPSFRRIDRRH